MKLIETLPFRLLVYHHGFCNETLVLALSQLEMTRAPCSLQEDWHLCASVPGREPPQSIILPPQPVPQCWDGSLAILSKLQQEQQSPPPTTGEAFSCPCSQHLVVKPALEPRSLDCKQSFSERLTPRTARVFQDSPEKLMISLLYLHSQCHFPMLLSSPFSLT